ncbi:MAG: signal peptidase II [Kiritimatiellia bacterium]|nr:signal peptidase II [Kiritimatiellia bacterium]
MLTLALSSGIVISDQITKYAIRFSFSLGESKTIIASLFNLTYVRNTGAVWGWFQHQNEWLALVSLVVLFLIVIFYYYIVDGQAICSTALGLIAGGIIGNLIDRVRLGWVTDFLDFYWNDNHWPSFNIADSAICAGVCFYLLASLLAVFRKQTGPAVTD